MNSSLIIMIALALVPAAMAETKDGVVYKVRRADGADQYYQIVVPANLSPPATVDSRNWATPYVARDKISASKAGFLAVAWAGGVTPPSIHIYPNTLSTVGGSTPGGFYDASNVRVDSVELRNTPIPYYLFRMTGRVGQTPQTLYAAVLEDGRIVRPMPVGKPSQATHEKMRRLRRQ
jgi:hypothetical protein